MTVNSAEKFVAFLEQSNLFAADQLDTARAELATADDVQFPLVVESFVTRGWLTAWQAKMLLAGRHAFFLGRYKLLDHLGEGGMGSVLKAEQTPLGRLVAIKTLRTELVSSQEMVARFHREIQAAAALSHPNIVAAYDADEVAGRHFLVMEYVEGLDLSQLVKGGRKLPVGEACEYIRQAALGLEHAHERGMVHRDIKPSNLLLDSAGHVKILDMGLARIVQSHVNEQTELTQTGQIVGTPDYISPEQGRDTKSADIRSDVYSLGCSLYRLLTGRVPFEGDGAIAKITARLVDDPPKLCDTQPDAPAELDAVLLKMMARDVEQRYQTPSEVVRALTPFADIDAAHPQVGTATARRETRSLKETGFLPAPELNDFLNQLADEAAHDAEADTGPQELQKTQLHTAQQASGGRQAADPLAPTMVFDPAQDRPVDTNRPPKISRAGRKLQDKIAARKQADKRKLLIGAAIVTTFIAAIVGLVAWQQAGETTLVIDWPLNERDGATIKVAGRAAELTQQPRLRFSGPEETRTLQLTRNGYKPIETTLKFTRSETKTFRPEWEPTTETTRQQQLSALKNRVIAFHKASRGVNPPGPDAGDQPDLWLKDPTVVALRTALVQFQNEHPGTTAANSAASLLSRLPCPLDLLQRDDIDAEQLKIAGRGDPADAPATLVAVLGDGRMKNWGGLSDVAFHPDGTAIATATTYDEDVNLWSIETGNLLKTIKLAKKRNSGRGGRWSVDFSNDGKWMLSIEDRQAQLWNAETFEWIKSLGRRENVTSVAFHPDGKRAITACGGGGGEAFSKQHVFIWDIESGEELHGFQNAGMHIAISPDGKLLASSGTGTLYVWDVETGEKKAEIEGGHSRISFSRDGKLLALAGNENGVVVRSTADFSIQHTHKELPGLLSLGPDSKSMLLTDGVWNVETGEPGWRLPDEMNPRFWAQFNRTGSVAAVAKLNGGGLHLFETTTGNGLSSFAGHAGSLLEMSLSADGRFLATIGVDFTIRIWDLTSGVNTATLTEFGAMASVAIDPAGKNVVFYGSNRGLMGWSLESDDTKVIPTARWKTLSLNYSRDGRYFVSANEDSTVNIRDPATHKILRILEGHTATVRCQAISGDSRRIVTGDEEGMLYLWDADTGRKVWSMKTGVHMLNCITLSRDGETVAYSAVDGSFQVRKLEGGSEPFSLIGHEAGALSADFSPDGRLLASSSKDGTVRIWDARPGGDGLLQTVRLGPNGGVVRGVRFTPDGRHLITANGNGTLYVLRLKEWSAE